MASSRIGGGGDTRWVAVRGGPVWARLAVALVMAGLVGCAGPGLFGPGLGDGVEPARVSEALDGSGAARRASLRLVIVGLDDEAAGQGSRARASYERALQVDASNPYAYLAIARHHIQGPEPQRAHGFLDQATSLFESEGALGPEVEVQLLGLRGEAYLESGDFVRAHDLLAQAKEMAPIVWGDGHLSAAELR